MASVTGMHWNMSFWAALTAVLLASWPGLAMSMTDQERPNVAPKSCWLPASLGSFQGTYHCSSSVMILECGTTEEVAGIVQHYTLVEDVGVGHSHWLQEQLHSGNKASVVTDLNITVALHSPMPASSIPHEASISPMKAFLLGVASTLAAGAVLMLAAKWASLPKSHVQACGGVLLGVILMSVLAACVPWGSPGLIAFVASCAWFASPKLAAMTVLLMVNVGCIKKADIKENKTVQWAFHLLPWLASGTVTVVVAQLLKADLAKGWAAWLQALVTIGIGLGALLVSGLYSEELQKELSQKASGGAAVQESQGPDSSGDDTDKQEHATSSEKQLTSVHSHTGNQSSGAEDSPKEVSGGAAAQKPQGPDSSGDDTDKQEHATSSEKQLTSVHSHTGNQSSGALQEDSPTEVSGGAAAQKPQGNGPPVEEADKQRDPFLTETLLPATSAHSHVGRQSSGAVYEQTSPQLLLKKWITERSRDGYHITSRAGRHGIYSEVMMIKKSTPYTQQAFMVEDEFPSLQLWDYWEHGFYITSLAVVGTQWAVVMSTNAGFEDQYVKDVNIPSKGSPSNSHALGPRGDSPYKGDPGDFQVTACAANKSQLAIVMSKPVNKTQKILENPSLPSPHWEVSDGWARNLHCVGMH